MGGGSTGKRGKHGKLIMMHLFEHCCKNKEILISKMFASNKITLHNSSVELSNFSQNSLPKNLCVSEGIVFGILELEVGKTEITRKPQEINIMLDESGSMNDCGEDVEDSDDEDEKSKMDLTKHVVKNIMEFVSKECKDADVKIGVHAFNNHVRQIFERTKITDENIETLTNLVQDIHAMDGTNMEKSLSTLKSLTLINENASKSNILMSDGDANDGIKNPDALARKVDSSAANYFVGFGLEHNPQMFSALSARENSSYYFVDKLDKSGLIYGEIMYNILYNKYNSVKLEIVNPDDQTFLYDYLNNEWKTQIFIGKMSGEMKKTIHILSKTKDKNILIKVTGYDAETDAEIEQIIMWDQDIADLSKYIFRQRTLELIQTAKICNNMNSIDLKNMKYELKMFTLEMKEYMKSHHLLEDKLMMSLCDDVVVIYRTIGTEHGLMYACARQSSQGAQRLNANSNTPINSGVRRNNVQMRAPCKQRACFSASACNNNSDDDSDEEDCQKSARPLYDPDCQNGFAKVFNFVPIDEVDDMMENHTMTEVECTETQTRIMSLISKTDDEDDKDVVNSLIEPNSEDEDC